MKARQLLKRLIESEPPIDANNAANKSYVLASLASIENLVSNIIDEVEKDDTVNLRRRLNNLMLEVGSLSRSNRFK